MRFPTTLPTLCFAAALLPLGCAPAPAPVPPPAAPAPAPVVAAPPAFPAAETQGRAWLAVFNGGDRAALTAFLEKSWPSKVAEVDPLLRFRAMTGGFELKQVQYSTAERLVALLKERDSDQFARLDVEVAPDAAHVITRLDLDAIPTPPDFALPRMTEGDALSALGAELQKAVAADRFAGAALVARRGKVLFAEAYGLANRETKAPNQLGTQFRMGSMNKMFTAVGVLQLAQAGKVKLDAPLRTYLPDYPNHDLARKVTLHHLLTHTGGTGDIFGPEFDKHRLELRTLQDYLKLYGARALDFEPGARSRYSNYGFILLGLVIEKVSGQPYYDYVRQRIFAPAGMRATDSLPEDVAVPGRAMGYTRDPPSTAWQPNTTTLPYRGTSAGGGYTTVEDLLRFAVALQDHVLLDATHTDLLITPKALPAGGMTYGYGIATEDRGGLRCFGHGGGAPGMNGELMICPREGYVIAVLANLDPPAANRAGEYVSNRLPLAAAGAAAP